MTITPGGKSQKPTWDDLKWLGWLLEDSIGTDRFISLRAFSEKRRLPQTSVTRRLRALNDHLTSVAGPETADGNVSQDRGNLFVIHGDGIRLTDRGSEVAVVGLILGSCLKLLESDVPAAHRQSILRRAYQQIAGDFRGIETVVRHNKRFKGSLRRYLPMGDKSFDWLIPKPIKMDPEEIEEMIRLQEAYDGEEDLAARRREEEIENEERRWCKERGIDYDEYISRDGD